MATANWKPGDTCVMVTNKANGYTSEFTIENFDGRFYGIRRGAYYHRVSPDRIFPSREDALISLREKVTGAGPSAYERKPSEQENGEIQMGGP